MHRIVLALLVVTAGAGVATADGTIRLSIKVGETVSRDVGWARGAVCDDPSIVRAEVRAKTANTNAFVMTGLKAGTTLCRAGATTLEARPSQLFSITVVEATTRR